MKPIKCSACQGQNLFFGRLGAGVYPATLFLGRPARISVAVCLSCGAVNPYLSEDQLEKVNAWKSAE